MGRLIFPASPPTSVVASYILTAAAAELSKSCRQRKLFVPTGGVVRGLVVMWARTGVVVCVVHGAVFSV